jgi:cytochrome P450
MTAADDGRAEPYIQEFEFLDPQLANDFWDRTAELREQCPISWSNAAWSDTERGFWLLNRYQDVSAAALDWERFTSECGASPFQFDLDLFRMIPLEKDPPVHRQIRRMVAPFFVPDAIMTSEPAIRMLVDELLDNCAAESPVDFVRRFAAALPPRVFFEAFLGEDPAEIAWVIQIIDGLFQHPEHAEQEAPKLLAWCGSILQARRSKGRRDDLVGVIAHANEDHGLKLSEKEKLETLHLVVLAGMETTQAGLANVAHHLARDQELRARLRGLSPAQVDRAVDEFLRFEAPVPFAARTVTADFELDGCPLQKGDRVMLNWGSANRDRATFADPDVLDVARTDAARHVSFGAGVHRCLGSHLAKREIAVAIDAICRLSTFALEPGTEVRWKGGMGRGPVALPVHCAR